jgi:hypothetical protein
MEAICERLSESPILGRVHPVLEAARALEIGTKIKRSMILADSAIKCKMSRENYD